MNRRPLAIFTILTLLAVLLSACEEQTPTPTPTPLQPTPTITPEQPTPVPAVTSTVPFPTGQPLTLTTYRHKTGVFTIPRPVDWDVLDDSTDQRLMVRFIPPVGFGSRVTVEVTSPGTLTPDEMRGAAESFISRTYAGTTAYRERSRGDLPDGRYQVVFDYNDGRGAAGTETLLVQQAASFFVTVRMFVSESDSGALASLVDSIEAGITVEPTASWGTSVGAINPAELLVVNARYWRMSSDRGFYFGDVYNASPSAITNIQIKISVCDSAGAVIAQLTQPALLKRMVAGGKVPFRFTFDKPQQGINVCQQSVTADPAGPDPTYTTELGVKVENRPRGGFVVNVDGSVTNITLMPVKNIHLVVVIYDAQGIIVGLTEVNSPAEQLFQPGQSLPVKYVFETLADRPDHMLTLIEAETVPPTNPSLNP